MKRVAPVVLILAMLGMPLAIATENKGADQIMLEGGSRGLVPFAHHRHQTSVAECNRCHQLFAQKKDSIKALKASGALANKQVMNKLCIQCHKEKKQSGTVSGPVICSQCHIRE